MGEVGAWTEPVCRVALQKGDYRNVASPGNRTASYGRGEHQIDDKEATYAPDAVVERLRAKLSAEDYQPPVLPATALELMSVTRQPDASFGQVKALLEQDSVLTANLIKVSQSAHYSRGAKIDSIDAAIRRLGLETTGNVFMQTALSAKVFRAKGYEAPMEAIRRHSAAVAHISRLTCRKTALPDEYAFMCGLLHDVGFAAGMLVLAAGKRRPPPFAEIAPALQLVHEEASEILGRAWKLPADVQLVLRYHHEFELGGRPHPMAAAVCLSDWLAAEAGAPLGGEALPQTAGRAARAIGLSEKDVMELAEKAKHVVAAL